MPSHPSPPAPQRPRTPARPDAESPARRPRDRRSWLVRFVDDNGWRAYAVPVLVVATVVWIGNVASGSTSHASRTPAAATRTHPITRTVPPSTPPPASAPRSVPPSGPVAASADRDQPTALPTGHSQRELQALPAGASYPLRGDGTFALVPGSTPVSGTGPLHRYRVSVERGLSIDAAGFAAAVAKTLGDRRGWVHGGAMSFQRVSTSPADFTITLTSSLTERSMCGYTLKVETSCFNGGRETVYVNVSRWIRGAVAFGGDIPLYRYYVVNHEVGHALGHHHMTCPKTGSPAPLMMEQTLGTTTGGRTCRPNAWPYVNGVFVTGPPAAGY